MQGLVRTALAVMCLIVGLGLVAEVAAAEEVSGRVRDVLLTPPNDGESGVLVELRGVDNPMFYDVRVTGPDGSYQFQNVPPGNYTISLPTFFPNNGWQAIVIIGGVPQAPPPPPNSPAPVPIAPGSSPMVDFPFDNTTLNPNPDTILGVPNGNIGGFLYTDDGGSQPGTLPVLAGRGCDETWLGSESGLIGGTPGGFNPGGSTLGGRWEPPVAGAQVTIEQLLPPGPTVTRTTDVSGYWQIDGAIPGIDPTAVPQVWKVSSVDGDGTTRYALLRTSGGDAGSGFNRIRVFFQPQPGGTFTPVALFQFRKLGLPLGCPPDSIAGSATSVDTAGTSTPRPGLTVNLVTDYIPQGLVPGAPVPVIVDSTTTGADGSFSFLGMPPGLYRVVLGDPTDPNAPSQPRIIVNGPTSIPAVSFIETTDAPPEPPEPEGCQTSSTCEGDVHELTVTTQVFVGETGNDLDVRAWMFAREGFRFSLTDQVAMTTGPVFPGPETGLDGVITIEDVTVFAGIANVTLKLTAAQPAVAGGKFGDTLRWLIVMVDGQWRAGWARFTGDAVRPGAMFAWSDRCGTRGQCGEPDQIADDAPWWCLPAFTITDNVSYDSWRACNPPPPCPDQSADGSGGYNKIVMELEVCAPKRDNDRITAKFWAGWRRMNSAIAVTDSRYVGDRTWRVRVEICAPAGADGKPGALPKCWSHVVVKVNGRRRSAWWDGDNGLKVGPYIGWAGDFLYDVIRFVNADDAMMCAMRGG